MWDKLKSMLLWFSEHGIGAFKLAASFIAARVMAAFGLTWVTYRHALPDIKAWLNGYVTVLPDNVKQLVSALGVDVFMVMILSAIAAQVGTRVFLAGVSHIEGLIQQGQG